MHRLNVFILLLGLSLLSACSGNLSAKVFLDANADNKANGQDFLLAKMPATLYRDGAEVEKLQTDAEGKVNFVIWEKGKYCVRLDPAEVSQLKLASAPKSLSTKALRADAESTPEPTPSSDPAPSPSAEPEEKGTSQTITTAQAYEGCVESKGLLNLSVEVPVPLDFAKTIESIPEPAVYAVNAGDEIEIPIIYPRHCSLKGITLPEAVGVPGKGDLIRTITDWNEIVALGAKPIVDTDPLAVNRDTLREFPLKLKVTSKIFDLDPPRVEITPQVSCPGGRDLDLKTHVLETGGQEMIEIYHDREGQAVPGGEAVIVTHVINHSDQLFPGGSVNFIFTAPQFGDTVFDAACGGSSHCSFNLEPKQQKDLRTTIQIPDPLNQITAFQLSATLKVMIDGYERVFSEEAPAEFSVLPN